MQKRAWWGVALVVAGCARGSDGGFDAGVHRLDAGGVDAAPLDAGRDAGALDAGPPDSGPPDAGPPDSGPPDSGPPDSGPPDSGPPDSGPPDPGPPDSGARDSGPPDAGVVPLPVTDALVLHLDARDVLGDGSTPSTMPGAWLDLTGGNDAACTNVRWEASGLANGHPAIRTVSSAASHCVFPIQDLTDVSIFVVLRTTDTRVGSEWWSSPVIVGGDRADEWDDAAFFLSGGRAGFARRDARPRFDSTRSIADDRPHALSLVRVSASGVVTYRVDDFALETGSAPTGAITEPSVWRLGRHDNEANGRIAALYGEVLIYSRALAPSERAAVHEYLAARWGL